MHGIVEELFDMFDVELTYSGCNETYSPFNGNSEIIDPDTGCLTYDACLYAYKSIYPADYMNFCDELF